MKTIKAKISFILYMALAGIILLISFTVYSETKQKGAEKKEDFMQGAVLQSKDIKYGLSEARKYERQYLKNPRESNAELVISHIGKVQEQAGQLKKSYQGHQGIAEHFSAIEKNAALYSKDFSELIKLYEQMGYTAEQGLYKELNNKADLIEKQLAEKDEKTLSGLFSMTRLYADYYSATKLQEPYSSFNSSYAAYYKAARDSGMSSKEKTMLLAASDDYQQSFSTFVSAYLKTNNLNLSFDKLGRSIEKEAASLELLASEEQSRVKTEISQEIGQLGLYQIIISVVIAAVLLIIGLLLQRGIHSSIRALKEGADRIGSGDLSYRVSTAYKDEMNSLAETFNQMAVQVGKAMGHVRSSAVLLNSSSSHLTAISEETAAQSTEVTEAIKQVAAGSSLQAAELDASNMIMKNISSAMHETEIISRDIENEAIKTEREGREGIQTVERLENTSKQFLDFAALLTDRISSTSEQAHSISSIVGTISEIAENTDLLALNAAIEAARAGEAGLGFSVVAQEVRKLAERSKHEAQQIQNLISAMNGQMDKLVREARKFNDYKEIQKDSVAITKTAFASIAEHVSKIAAGISTVQGSISEVKINNESLASKLHEIQLISEQAAGSSEEVSASSEDQLEAISQVNNAAVQMSSIASDLQMIVTQFTLREENQDEEEAVESDL